MECLINKITFWLIRKNVVHEKEQAIYHYGLEIFLSTVLVCVSFLILAFIFERVYETLAFFGSFFPIRKYAGGYHAKCRLSCFLCSIGSYSFFLLILSCIPKNLMGLISLWCTIISALIIINFAPVIHPNRNVTVNDRQHFKKICIYILCVETIFIFIAMLFEMHTEIIFSASLGLLFAAKALLFEKMNCKWSNLMKRDEKNENKRKNINEISYDGSCNCP